MGDYGPIDSLEEAMAIYYKIEGRQMSEEELALRQARGSPIDMAMKEHSRAVQNEVYPVLRALGVSLAQAYDQSKCRVGR